MSKTITASSISIIGSLVPFIEDTKISSVLTIKYTRSTCSQSIGNTPQHTDRKVDQIFSRSKVRNIYSEVYAGNLTALSAVSKMYQHGILLPHNTEMAKAWSGYSCISRAHDVPCYTICEAILKNDIKEILMEQTSEMVVSKKILSSSKLLNKALKHREHPLDKLPSYAEYVSRRLGNHTMMTVTPAIKGVQVALVYVRTDEGYTLYNGFISSHATSLTLDKLRALSSIPSILPKSYNKTLLNLEGHKSNSIIITGALSVRREEIDEYKHFYPKKNSIGKAVRNFLASNSGSTIDKSLSSLLTFVADSLFAYNRIDDTTSYAKVDSPYVLTHLHSLGFTISEIPDFFGRLIPISEVSRRNFISKIHTVRKSQNLIVNGFWLAPAKHVYLNKISRARFIL